MQLRVSVLADPYRYPRQGTASANRRGKSTPDDAEPWNILTSATKCAAIVRLPFHRHDS